MKILYIANARIPTEKAHGHQIMKMCEVFSSDGIDLELVFPTRASEEFKNVDPFDYYKIKKNFRLKKIFCFDPYWLMRFPGGLYIKFQSLFFIISLFFHLLFKKNKKDYIFYTRDEYLLFLLNLFSEKVIWEGHALSKNKDRYLKHLKRVFKLIVLTQELKNQLISSGIDEEKILVSPDAVDLNIFDIDISKEKAREELDLPKDKIILGYTGSFKTKGMDKGIEDILKAVKIMDRKDVLFVAVGGNAEDIDYYRQIFEKERIIDKVMLLEKVSQDKLAIYQKAFDILLMPFPFNQHYAYYMSPLKMFEYMASKRPIIASNLPSIREILNEDNSILVEPDSPESIAGGIQEVLQNKPLSGRIQERAYQDVKYYTWEKRAENIIEFIK